ncbi:hypothetical protein ABTL40_18980, partial [Acinetobacter baumannii]
PVYDAVIRRAGALRTEDLDDMFDAAIALSGRHHPHGGRLAICGNGRGLAVMAADAAVRAGLQPQGDPIDIGHHAAPGQYAGTVDRLARQAGADALLLVHAPYGMVPTGDVVQAVIPAAGTSAFWKA